MATFTSIRDFYCNSPIILSFDVNDYKLDFKISLIDAVSKIKNSSLSIKTNHDQGTYTEIIENQINNSSNHENNTFQNEKVIIEIEESESGYYLNDVFYHDKPSMLSKENDIITLDSSLENLSNGSMIFFFTKEASSDKIIYSNLGIFEQKDEESYSITPFVLSDENDVVSLLEIDNNSISFLLLGNEVSKDFSISNTTIYTKEHDTTITNDFQNTSDILKPPYRCRLVISNDGRMVTFSKFNTTSKKWELVKNFIFNMSKILKKQKIQIETENELTNITANF